MKKLFTLFFILFSVYNYAQDIQKQYKYIIVPLQYAFTSQPNEFQLSVLARKILKDEGFDVYMSENETLPKELAENKCLALKANIIKDSGFLTTTLKFQLYNCFGNKVFESIGNSRKKEYKKAYQDALQKALVDFQMSSSMYLKKDNKTKQETTPNTAEISDKIKKDIPFEDQAEIYINEGKTYWLLKHEEGYTLFLDKGDTIFATLKQADRGTYFFDSAEIEGAAYFNANGDIILEYLDKDEDAVQKIIYAKD